MQNDVLEQTKIYVIQRVFSIGQCQILKTLTPVKGHGHSDQGHGGGGGHKNHAKDLLLNNEALQIWEYLKNYKIPDAVSVDPFMKLYCLKAPEGAVAPHKDIDFDGSDNTIATHSIIIYLNESFTGGATIFHHENKPEQTIHLELGDVLIFPHNLLHSGKAVEWGTKYVLKTDLFCKKA